MSDNAELSRPGFSALLIGVPHYTSEDFPSISTVPNDLHQLRLVLESSGYAAHVRVYPEIPEEDSSPPPLVTGPSITHELRKACEEAPEDGVLFLYFSGHGVSQDGRDYLVPGDVQSYADAMQDLQFLVSVDLSRYLKKCKAHAVIFAVDACRDNLDPGKGFRMQATSDFGYGAINPDHKTRVTTIYGCDREQFCYFSNELKMSLFTKALCTVLSPEHKAQKLAEVITSADEVLTSLVAQYKPHHMQRVHVVHEGGAGSIGDQVICEGSADPWRAAIHDSPLWRLILDATAEQMNSYRRVAESIASDVWNGWQANAADLPDDPWRDAYYLPRCLDALALLVPEDAQFSAAEILVLTTAPFLAEAAYSEGVGQLLAYEPLNLSAGLSREQGRQELEAAHSAYPRVWQKATTMANNQPVDAAVLATWLMYRCIFRQVRLWSETAISTLSQKLAKDVERRAGFRGDLAASLRGVASFLGTGAEELEAFVQGSSEGDRIKAGKDAEIELDSGKRVRIRGRLLAVLLSIAGLLAFDLRRFSEVVVDHTGIRDPLDPADLRRAVREAQWVLSDDHQTLNLEARCVHPAIHLALQEVCEAVQQQLNVAHRWARNAGDAADPVRLIPLSVSADALGPELDRRGRRVYETPLLQFRLAHNEIRDLLMGTRLYGDPALAIRELYQNALDACRYRSLRARFRGQPYEGNIRIKQDIEEGRPYIECIDNGVGMGRRELENTFSRAGRRFVTSTEFLWEQAEWLRVDDSLRLWPNSQFGIGVFSYFMLADEIFVETAQVDRVTNSPGDVLHVQISSSGSLFRITTAERSFQSRDDVGVNGGTRIRLYLRDQEADQVSCVDTLKKLLWYSEFSVEATHAKEQRVWAVDTLNPSRDIYELLIPQSMDFNFVGRTGHDIWWTEAQGMLLADGIVTDVKPFGYIVNLAGENRPMLSVDRNKLEGWNTDWVRDQLRGAAAQLQGLPIFNFIWLQQFASEEPEVAQEIVSVLVSRDARLPIGGNWRGVAAVSEVGLWPTDSRLFDSSPPFIYRNRLRWGANSANVDASRFKVWHQNGVTPTNAPAEALKGQSWIESDVWAVPTETHGHPRLEPIDAIVMEASGYESSYMLPMLETSRETQIPLAKLLRRVRRFVIHGAMPPPALDRDLDFIPDQDEIRIISTLKGAYSAMLTIAGRLSYQTGRPLAWVIERTRLYLELTSEDGDTYRVLGGPPPSTLAAYTAHPDYVCRTVDAEMLSVGFDHYPRHDEFPFPNARNWLRILLHPAIRRQDAEVLMQALNVPFELLQRLADDARANGSLSKALSVNADPSQSWLEGEITFLHLLIGSSVTGETPGKVAGYIASYEGILGFQLPADLSVLPPDPVPEEAASLLRLLNEADLPSNEDLEPTGYDLSATYVVIALLSYHCELSPRDVMRILDPYRTFLRTIFPGDCSHLPDRGPTEKEWTILNQILADDLRTSEALLRATARQAKTPLSTVRAVARRWQVPLREDKESDLSLRGPQVPSVQHPIAGAAKTYADEDLASLNENDRRVLSRDLDAQAPYLSGEVAQIHVIKAALANDETIGRTIERVKHLARTFEISPPDVEWGEMKDADLPRELGMLFPDFHAAVVIRMAYDSNDTVAAVFRRFQPFTSVLAFPSLTGKQLKMLENVPDEQDVVVITPSSTRDRRDALHVIRVAGRLGLSIGEVTKRISAFESILEEVPPLVPVEADKLVPDWRDLVIVTPGLDGRRLITDEELTDAHIARAAREVETTPEDVRRRLSCYAAYCGFTAAVRTNPGV